MNDSRFHHSRSAISAVPAIAAVLATLGFIGLGMWQLERAAEKRALFASFARGQDSVMALEDALAAAARGEDMRFRAVSMRGRYDSMRQFLLQGMLDQGRVGYHVLTPLMRSGGGEAIVVDRGWLPQQLVDERPSVLAVDAGTRRVNGRLDRLPLPGMRLGPAGGSEAGWPQRMLYPTSEDLAAALGFPIVAYRILLDPEAPDGFERNWRPAAFSPDRHLAYAVQWFALALTVVVVFVVLRRRGARAESDAKV